MRNTSFNRLLFLYFMLLNFFSFRVSAEEVNDKKNSLSVFAGERMTLAQYIVPLNDDDADRVTKSLEDFQDISEKMYRHVFDLFVMFEHDSKELALLFGSTLLAANSLAICEDAQKGVKVFPGVEMNPVCALWLNIFGPQGSAMILNRFELLQKPSSFSTKAENFAGKVDQEKIVEIKRLHHDLLNTLNFIKQIIGEVRAESFKKFNVTLSPPLPPSPSIFFYVSSLSRLIPVGLLTVAAVMFVNKRALMADLPKLGGSFKRNFKVDMHRATELYGLVRECQELARRVNYPATALLFAAFKQIFDPLIQSFGSTYVQRSLLSESVLILFRYGVYYKSWSLFSDILLKSYPRGIFFDNTPHPAFSLQHNISLRSETEGWVQELRSLARKQEAIHKLNYKLVLIVFAILPFLNFKIENEVLFFVRPRRWSLFLDNFGPYFELSDEGDDPVWGMFLKMASLVVQRIPLYNYLIRQLVGYRLSDRLAQYLAQLNGLNLLPDSQWERVGEEGQNTSLFKLNVGALSDCYGIGSERFLGVLQESFADQGVRVFKSDEVLFVAYSRGLDVRKLKLAIDRRKLSILKIFEGMGSTASWLNELDKKLGVNLKWDCDFYEVEGEARLEYYFLEASKLQVSKRDHLFRCLKSYFELDFQDNLDVIVKLKSAVALPPIDQVLSKNQSASDPSVICHPSPFVLPPKKRVLKYEAIPLHGVLALSVSHSPVLSTRPVPQAVRDLCRGAELESLAYLVRFPFLREGAAYVCILLGLFEGFDLGVENQARAHIEKGTVHGRGAKTKFGGVGMQLDDQPYFSAAAVGERKAVFKVKFGNYRFFAQSLGEVASVKYFVLDGHGMGH